MQQRLTCFVLSALSITANALPQLARLVNRANGEATITQLDVDPSLRSQEVAANRAGYLYAPSLMGNASFHLTGLLGDVRKQRDLESWLVDRNIVNASLNADLVAASVAISANLGLRSVDDYAKVLYGGQWKRAVPDGEAPGMLTNYTQDLLFSMERLTLNPYPLHRYKETDPLPFQLPEATAVELTGRSLEALKFSGRLFVVDHSYQAKYEKSARFGAACTAYFFIHPESGDFLPLAIKTNTGSDLIYTPLDTANDWLLAKMMFNVNDLFHSQFFHLAGSHDVGEIVHEAALKTLSLNHPIMVILERLMYQAYAIRPYGTENLVQPGGPIDQAFYINANGASEYIAEYYSIVGRFQAGYLETFLKAQGLIGNLTGPQFKSFPFYNDAAPIQAALKTFFTTFVNSYYATNAVAFADAELQAWFVEANTDAGVYDFPRCGTESTPCGKTTIIEVLTHFAFLTGVSHHSLNTGDPSAYRAVLPFHPAPLYAPIPTTKNVTDIIPFLPPPRNALFHVAIFAAFSRAHFEATNRTLAYMFSEETVLGRLNGQTAAAADLFLGKMKALSAGIRARSFGADGLCLGMPFVWKALDPGSVPFFFAV